jgi:polyphosphate kinase
MFPVESSRGRQKVMNALDAMFRDNVKGRKLGSNGEWRVPPRRRGVEPFVAQIALRELAERSAETGRRPAFEPLVVPP